LLGEPGLVAPADATDALALAICQVLRGAAAARVEAALAASAASAALAASAASAASTAKTAARR
jgi:hypothetical protein